MEQGAGTPAHDTAKHAAAQAALAYVPAGGVLGVGTGTTVGHFIEALGSAEVRPIRAVSTSMTTSGLLAGIGIAVVPLASLSGPIEVYVDSADEIDPLGRAVKGGGGAHTQEKAVANASLRWVCIVDESKVVDRLGDSAPVPIEASASQVTDVMAEVAALGGRPHIRELWAASPGDVLIDVEGLDLSEPEALETRLESIAGVVSCGIFAHRRADVVLVGHTDGTVTVLEPK